VIIILCKVVEFLALYYQTHTFGCYSAKANLCHESDFAKPARRCEGSHDNSARPIMKFGLSMLHDGENRMNLGSDVSKEYQSATDRWTARQVNDAAHSYYA